MDTTDAKLLKDAIAALHALAHPQNFLATHNATTLKRRDRAGAQAHRVLARAKDAGFAVPVYDVTDMATGITHKRA